MNKTTLYGRLVKDPDLKYAPITGYAYLFNSIAVERYDKKEKKKVTDFFNIIIGGKNAENLATYSKKGGRILISGYLRNNTYNKNGEKRITIEIVVEQLKLIDLYKIDSNTSDINVTEIPEEDIPEVFMDNTEEYDFLN